MMNRSPKTLRAIFPVLVVLLLLFSMGGLFLVFSSLPEPQITPDPSPEINTRTKIGIVFQQAMQQSEVEERLRIDNAGGAEFFWEGNTLWIKSRVPQNVGTQISFLLDAGAHSLDGRVMRLSIQRRFTIRQPEILYLSTANASLWRVDPAGQTPSRQLSPDSVKVQSYATSFDGEWIAFSAGNALNSADVWLVDRDGKNLRRLVDCGGDPCGSPVWSPDGQKLAFLRHSVKETHARIWLVEISRGEKRPLFEDPAIGAVELTWSPGGRYLAGYDSGQKTIRILDFATGQTIMIRNQAQTAGSWSADERYFYYFDNDPKNLPPRGIAYRLDMTSMKASAMFMSNLSDLDYGLPMPSPTGQNFVVSRRLALGSHSMQLWLLNADASQERVINADFLSTRGAYSWDPTGRWVVYQQLALGSSRAEPEVWIWERESGQGKLVARQAARPQWLP